MYILSKDDIVMLLAAKSEFVKPIFIRVSSLKIGF